MMKTDFKKKKRKKEKYVPVAFRGAGEPACLSTELLVPR